LFFFFRFILLIFATNFVKNKNYINQLILHIMYKKFILPALLLLMIAGLFAACSSGLKPLAANYVKSDPQPLEMVAGKVPVTISATFPPKWFNKNATLTVIPVLRYDGGEAWGTSYTFQGEKVAGNGQVISQKSGGNVTMTSNFDYIPAMQKSELYLTFSAKVGKKEVALPEIKIGDGVLATASLVNAGSEIPAIAPDKFQRIIKDAYNTDIMFLIQQAELRASELKKSGVSDWKNTVANASQTPNQKVDVEVSAYASPDGGPSLNEKLAEKREQNTSTYLKQEMKKANANAPIAARYTAQDWEGFKELVEKSNIQDKQLILSVLSMYKDSEQREKEIKNISSVFSVLADEILPQLRRSRLTANIETIGKSDDQITQMAASDPKSLTVEELLYAASLANTNSAKETIYQKAAQLYPNDFRAFNNLGALDFQDGKIADAETNLNKALSLTNNSPETNLNLGLVALTKGDAAKAQQLFGKASGVSELNNAMGLLAIQNGNYSQAVNSFGNSASNNAALAQVLTKDYSKAQATLNAVQNPNATTSYLKAIVAARTNNLTDVVSNLKQAVQLDPSLAKKATTDLEFVKYFTDSSFLNAIK
jgi:Flp pilus assembly protein TadD